MNKIYYKYKSIRDLIDLDRILDIINNKRIYMPSFDELNDPFESYLVNFDLSYAGSSITSAAGERPAFIDDIFKPYGILSLTDNCKNQVMWASYSNMYKGICLGFENLPKVKPIKYIEKNHSIPKLDSENKIKDKDIEKILMTKYNNWKYEQEYRLLSKDKFYNIEKYLKLIIIGHRIDEHIKEMLYRECINNNIEVYTTYIDYIRNRIIIKKYPFNIEYNGIEIDDDLN